MSLRPSHPQTPLTEEQRSLASSIDIARQQNVKNLDKAVLMIELRKWCVAQAVVARSGPSQIDVVAVAQRILDFVSAPIQE